MEEIENKLGQIHQDYSPYKSENPRGTNDDS